VITTHHREKAERIEAAIKKLTAADYEAVIEAAMLAGTHWFNIALHEMKLTAADADIMHAQYLAGDLRLMISLLAPAMLVALDEIEMLRPRFVRGNVAGGDEAARRALTLLETIRQAANSASRSSGKL
jgi:hypothetical protein